MAVVSFLVILSLVAGQLWFAYEVWQREDLLWAILLLLVPFPLLASMSGIGLDGTVVTAFPAPSILEATRLKHSCD
ncbi:MAG: hypothetical protein ACREP9_04020, partial [Candidatus Dormibacteraceae bacterium]